jgi:nucleoside-diphosphate-sugar epimerase
VNLLLQASAARAALVSGNVYNAGNGVRTTLNQVWSLLQQMEGVTLPAHYAPERPGDVRDSQADMRAAIRDLGYQPQYSLEQGLRLTLDWYRG